MPGAAPVGHTWPSLLHLLLGGRDLRILSCSLAPATHVPSLDSGMKASGGVEWGCIIPPCKGEAGDTVNTN